MPACGGLLRTQTFLPPYGEPCRAFYMPQDTHFSNQKAPASPLENSRCFRYMFFVRLRSGVSFLLFRKHITAFLGQFQHVFSFYIANKRFFLHPRFSFYFLNKRVEFSFYFLNKQISYWCNFSFYFANKHVSERCEFSFYFVNTWR